MAAGFTSPVENGPSVASRRPAHPVAKTAGQDQGDHREQRRETSLRFHVRTRGRDAPEQER